MTLIRANLIDFLLVFGFGFFATLLVCVVVG